MIHFSWKKLYACIYTQNNTKCVNYIQYMQHCKVFVRHIKKLSTILFTRGGNIVNYQVILLYFPVLWSMHIKQEPFANDGSRILLDQLDK